MLSVCRQRYKTTNHKCLRTTSFDRVTTLGWTVFFFSKINIQKQIIISLQLHNEKFEMSKPVSTFLNYDLERSLAAKTAQLQISNQIFIMVTLHRQNVQQVEGSILVA